ncbi:NAD-dependent epimerase/dehydratase family protein [Hydrogenovibrio marinus]|uniref:NAD-dependent epimerase/dehydratase domain-containing protein n=2 Tax=Hydrogenovibrio marinus TaxID=28885 RepID=A0A066ZSG8_HYDMR|nr:NAD-dependent epimerase/dehydratase family protein [Hydrogenovibrio marinus]KDN96738.1 hypothetical protein EI16_10860 [Hydrogenovibrio marinus]BBN58983.1 dTDP-glucose 4,6-dehydratase [Hydrogenovibrio marinus]
MRDFIAKDLERSLDDILEQLSPLRGAEVLITGGTGFVGSWLARALCWLNDYRAFDTKIILLSRTPLKLKEADECFFDRSDVSFIKSDIRSIKELPQSISYIIHAAASPDNRVHMSDPVNTMDVIANGTKSILDAASRLADLKCVMHLSSGQVYESLNNGELIEEGRQRCGLKSGITSIYPEAKQFSESLCMAYRSQYKVPVVVVRPFAFIGPFQSLNKPWAVNSFLQEALNAQPIRILGNGKPKRSYLYATDMAAWLLAMLASGRDGGVYNLGSSEEVSLLDVAVAINSILKDKVDIVVKEIDSSESKFIPDLSFVKESFKVKENFSFTEALNRTVEWNLYRLGRK